MSKQQSARLDTCEKDIKEIYKRVDALLLAIEELKRAPAVSTTPQQTYQAAFDRWPGNQR